MFPQCRSGADGDAMTPTQHIRAHRSDGLLRGAGAHAEDQLDCEPALDTLNGAGRLGSKRGEMRHRVEPDELIDYEQFDTSAFNFTITRD